MGAVLVDVAEAVKEQLNDHDFGLEFDAVRTNAKRRIAAKDLGMDVWCDVVPVMWTSGIVGRGGPDIDPTVDIFLRRKLGVAEQEQTTGEIENEEIDRLVQLAQDVAVLFQPDQTVEDRNGRLDTYEDAAWISTKVMSGYVTDKFAQTRIWQAQIRLTFTVGL